MTEPFRVALATSPAASPFAPLLFAGRVDRAIAAAAEFGYDGVELSLRAAAEVDAPWLAEELESRGLVVSALGSGRAFLEDGLSFSDPDRRVRREAVARLGEHITLASRFGAVVILGLLRGSRPPASDPDGVATRRRMVECTLECATEARARGVGLVVEAINRYETSFLNTAAQALEFLDEVGDETVGVLLDVFHMNIEEARIGDAIRMAGPRLGYFHVVDSNRHAPGAGHVDYADVKAALGEVEYGGWFSAEVLPHPDDLTAARAAVGFVRAW